MSTITHRVALDDPAARASAEDVAADLAAMLQRGWDAADADRYDDRFAADLLWGSPFGATLAGFGEVNTAHHRLMNGLRPSRFEVVAVIAPAPGVVVTHIRRRSLDDAGFSEMALYVLAERDGQWWLAAAQNTPIRTEG